MQTNEIEISIVVPAYNEAETLHEAIRTLIAMVQPLTANFEILLVDDGSRDSTFDIATAFSETDPRVTAIQLARNFGKEAAMWAGLRTARGKCVIIIDADLQHPPDIIPAMYREWKDGAEIVNAIKDDRGKEGVVYRLFANSFNRLMYSLTRMDTSDSSDFKLLDREVVDALTEFPERNRFFRGLVQWVGFRTKNIHFQVQDRLAGTSKWGFFSLLKYAVTNIISFSSLPLIFIAYSGFIVVGFGFILLLQTLYRYFAGSAVDGFTTVITLQILLCGMILFCLGIISIYVAKLYDEQKSRPIAIIKKKK